MYLRQESVIWVYTNKPGYSERDSLGRRDLNPRVTRLRFLLLIRQRRYIPRFPRPSDGGWITPTVILVLLTTNFALREGLEPSTFGLTVRCSDQLSYRRMVNHVEGKVGLEPTLFQYFQSRVNSPPLNQFSYSPSRDGGRIRTDVCWQQTVLQTVAFDHSATPSNTNTSKNHKKTRLSCGCRVQFVLG